MADLSTGVEVTAEKVVAYKSKNFTWVEVLIRFEGGDPPYPSITVNAGVPREAEATLKEIQGAGLREARVLLQEAVKHLPG